MEQRPRPYLAVNEQVLVTVLGEREATSSGRVAKSSPRRVELLTGKPAEPGAAVKLERDHALYLGEVSSCRPAGDQFSVRVELRHALYNTDELAKLAQRLLDEETPGRRRL